jgi:FkbM family methyltransferase
MKIQMLSIVKQLIKNIFNLVGLEVQRHQPLFDAGTQIYQAIKKVRTDIILDVGANTGQFSLEMRKKGYNGKIVSFEPLISVRKKLIEHASKDANWLVHEQAALGGHNGFVDINISKNSVSSSILPMLSSHFDAENNSFYVDSQRTSIITLDSVANDYLNKSSNCFIKIDTQGYEWQVLDGAANTLKKSKGVLCELSLIPLYEGQHLWKKMIERLEKDGFILWSFQKAFTDKRDGRTLQIDAVFLRDNVV